MAKPNIAVILFPGINMELEMVEACVAAGMDASIVRWNEIERIASFDGYIIGGGFSFEDRVRSGVVAAQEPMMDALRVEAEKGKPILGVCNGCQILIESGLVPNVNGGVEFGMAPNKNPAVSGYYNDWIHIRSSAPQGRSAFTQLLEEGGVMHVPVAHGEGRFVTGDTELLQKLIDNNQVVFRYCSSDGDVSEDFPISPNGATYAIAGLCNPEGNVVAMMPHPERCVFVRQLPDGSLKEEAYGDSSRMEGEGPGRTLFLSMKKFIEERG